MPAWNLEEEGERADVVRVQSEIGEIGVYQSDAEIGFVPRIATT